MKNKKEVLRIKRHNSLRKAITGTAEKPRLAVHRSLANMAAQVVDDVASKTLFSLSTTDKEVKAKFPLREAKVEVRDQPGKPGAYQCIMHLAPHYELDELSATVRVVTELAPPRGA